MDNRTCLECLDSYEARPGQVTGGLCPACSEVIESAAVDNAVDLAIDRRRYPC